MSKQIHHFGHWRSLIGPRMRAHSGHRVVILWRIQRYRLLYYEVRSIIILYLRIAALVQMSAAIFVLAFGWGAISIGYRYGGMLAMAKMLHGHFHGIHDAASCCCTSHCCCRSNIWARSRWWRRCRGSSSNCRRRSTGYGICAACGATIRRWGIQQMFIFMPFCIRFGARSKHIEYCGPAVWWGNSVHCRLIEHGRIFATASSFQWTRTWSAAAHHAFRAPWDLLAVSIEFLQLGGFAFDATRCFPFQFACFLFTARLLLLLTSKREFKLNDNWYFLSSTYLCSFSIFL